MEPGIINSGNDIPRRRARGEADQDGSVDAAGARQPLPDDTDALAAAGIILTQDADPADDPENAGHVAGSDTPKFQSLTGNWDLSNPTLAREHEAIMESLRKSRELKIRKPCLRSPVEIAAEKSIPKNPSVHSAIQTLPSSLETSKMNPDRDLPAAGWKKVEQPLTPRMIEVLQALGANNCNVTEIVEKGVVTKTVLGTWIRNNKSFRSYWNDLVRASRDAVRMDAVAGLSSAVTIASQRLPGAELKDVVAAGKFFKDLVDDDPEINENQPMGSESTKTTTFDANGNVYSVTEQMRIISQIRNRRSFKDPSDEVEPA